MESKYGHEIRNALHNFFNHRQVNIIITGVILILGAYVSLIMITGQSILQPLAHVTSTTFSHNAVNEFVWSTMSLFLLLVISIVAEKIADLLQLPPLIGSLVVGVAMKNIPNLESVFFVNEWCHLIIRRLALTNIIIRAGLGFDTDFIKQHPILLLVVAFLSGTCEVAAISTASIFLFDFPVSISILLGYILATVSPAVIVPVIIKLINENLGSSKSIPKVILSMAFFDNAFCITIFILTATVTFSREAMFPTLVRTSGEIILCALGGLIIGWIIRWFPRANEPHTSFTRSLHILFLSTAIILGMFSVDCGYAGIVGCVCLIACARASWKVDNEHSAHVLDLTFTNTWNLVSSPLLFILVGMMLDFSKMTWTTLWICVALICLGILARVISILIFTSCSGFKFREQFIIAISFIPKATVQCALGPAILIMSEGFPVYSDDTQFIVIACIISVLVTAPIGRLLLSYSAPKLLRKNFNHTIQISPEETFVHNEKVDDIFDSSVTFKQFKTLQQAQNEQNHNRGYEHY